ncbi:MAG: DegV family protein [Turicibacter sp.]|nr:DegV family protein [Turicibacter sp.]
MSSKLSKKVAIVSDSTSGLTDELLKEYHIFTSYLMIIFEQDSYQEFKEVSPEKFIELSNAQKELPTTSQPSPGLTVEIYENILKEGYDEIIHLTISSALSGSYASAVSAAEMVDASKIHVYDTKNVAYPQGALAIEAAKLANAGKSADEVLARLAELQENVKLIAAIDDMTNLKKGGRVSAISASLGSVLQIKPVLSVNPEGMLEAEAKVRTFKKAIDFLVDAAKEAKLDASKDEIGILHMENPEAAAQIKAKVLEIYPDIDIVELPLSLVVSVHAGPGAAAIGWIKR